ncbi:Hypothetical predicted protein [Marmota monax]|uniref:Uncharacterized protein n=1 Tax=Marmota monax TaxID=9995 RepID=A0A5E4AVY8_MARMO|nr:hypothetical protein GHT09_018593 [Marmota monax]VTJ61633.1 Hypothetical predicted protein [Marmota monax]
MQSREEPLQLKLDTYRSVFFKPTWVGCSSTSSFTFRNPSRLPLEFEWRVSQQHQKTLAVQPAKGLIQPNESLTLTWIFSPLEETKYLFRVGMCVWEAGLPLNTKPPAITHYMIRLVGMGITSSLSAEAKELDFGNVLVTSRESRNLALLNDGNCTLYYRLYLEQHSPVGDDHNSPGTQTWAGAGVRGRGAALELDRSEGSMPPHSKDNICLTACPQRRSQYSWTISYSLLSHRGTWCPAWRVRAGKDRGEGRELCAAGLWGLLKIETAAWAKLQHAFGIGVYAASDNNKVGEKKELCQVSLVAVYPLLSVLDAYSMGSAEGITRKHLWRLFSLDMLNNYLARDPTPGELTYQVPTRHSTNQTPPVFTPLKLDFNFGVAPLKAPPSVVLLDLKNIGMVPLDWYGWPGGGGLWGCGGARRVWKSHLLLPVGNLAVWSVRNEPPHGQGVQAQVGLGSPNSSWDLSLAETC